MTQRRNFPRAVLTCFSLVLLAACASSRGTSGTTEPAEELPTPQVQMSDYEDFDASAYREPSPSEASGIEHDVPENLMEGRADSGVRTSVQGFRVQVFSTLDKNAAVQHEEAAKDWWRVTQENAPPDVFSGDMPVSIVYIQPYYRVRIGNFTSRATAESARSYLAQRFPEAFIVPDTISVTR